jgi:hypothetical protein
VLIAVVAIVAFGAGYGASAYVELQRPHFVPDLARIDAYAVSADGRELTIFASIGDGDQLGSPVVTEESTKVSVKLPSFRFMPANGGFKNLAAYFVQSRVTLREPLGDRTVFDATTRQAVRRSAQ